MDVSPCGWAGITCANGHVTHLRLADNNLTGTMPDICPLAELKELDISNNRLTGNLPNLCQSGLEVANLSNNQFSGTLPDLTGLTQLKTLGLANNQLEGKVPDFSQFPNLKVSLGGNQLLSGTLSVTQPIPEVVVPQGSSPMTIDLTPYFKDTSGGPITYRMSFNSNANVVTTSLQNNNLLLTFGGPGLSEITVEARDSIGMTVQSTFKVTVNQAVQMAVYTPSCSNEGETIESSCVGQEQVLKVSKIEEQASISNIIIDSSIENHGWISNSKVTPNGSLTGGTLTGYISNEGTITNVDFVGAELKGGMLSGKIVNNSKIGGVIKDVKLDKDTVLQGGNIEGNIEGNCDSPALLEDVTVKTGSTLSCVVLGKNVKLEGDVKQDRVTVKEQTQGGNGSTPEVAKVTQMDIGNVTVYADNIEPAKGSKSSFTATGNVAIGRVGGYKILQINGTGLELDYLQNSVKTQGKGDVVALDIKASPSSSPKNMPIYAGGFEIDASENPPKLDIKAQDREGSILELEPLRAFEGSTFFETMTAPTEISIETNKVTVKNIAIQFSKAVGFPLEFGDIVLSQENDSTFEVTLSFADLFKVAGEVPVIVPPIPIRRDSLWTVSNLEGSYDLLTGKLTMSGEFQIPYTVDGLFAKLGFTTNPMELDHLELALLTNGRFPSIPPSPPSPFGAKLEKVGFAVKEIANPKPLVLSGYGDFSLTDAAHVSDAIEKWGLKVITARVDLTIDFDGKVILSAQKAKLLEHFDLGSLSLTLGNPVDLSGKITMFDMVSGELNLAGEILPNPQAPPAPPAPPMLEFRGFIEGVMQLPAYTPIIGKMELGAVKVKVTLRIATTGLHYALFKAGIRYGDEELAVSIFARDVLDPHISLHGFDKLCPDFIGKWIWCPDSVIQIRSNPGLRKNEPITVVNLDQDYNLVVMVVTSEKETPAVTLKLPNGNLQTMENTAKLSVSTQNDVAVVNNPVTHQTSYFLKKPMQGSYVVEVTNPADLGDYNVQLLLPSKKPTVTLTSQPQDQEWDGKSPISIDWSASDPNKDAKVSLYYGVSNTDNRGMTIAYDLPSTTSSYQWTPSPETPAGHYYVYVKIDDDKNMPVYSYSVGKITINNPTAPAAPEEVKLVAGDGNIAVSWQLSDETNLLGYRVYVSDTVGDNVFEKSIGVGLQTTHIIEGLTNGKTYEVAVSAINDKGLVSLLSPPQTQTPLGDSDAGDSDVVSTTAIDALGLFTKTNSHFKGGISVNGEPELPNVTHTTSDEISVIGEMTTDFAHLGKVIDWLVIGIYKPTPTSTPQLYMLEEPEVPIEQRAQAVPVIRPWDGDPKHLVAMKKAVILRPTQRLNLWQGQLSATGEVQIYYGYRLPDGTIVLNPQPLEDVITE
ncbi:MAG: hypothetical protein BWK78_05975 [Thiotrichaceae bacterium IS1]|nr:MAG: hypothetical protein BWK78_05975 [Thiotrichaceae bacterium IS1]